MVVLNKEGAILAMVGGRDYEDSQFNRAIQAKRQAGSLFKLFVYLTAYEKGLSPETVLVDRPIQIGDWEPQNASGRFRGAVPLRTAFAQSINTIAAQLADEIGMASVIETRAQARRHVRSSQRSEPRPRLGRSLPAGDDTGLCRRAGERPAPRHLRRSMPFAEPAQTRSTCAPIPNRRRHCRARAAR